VLGLTEHMPVHILYILFSFYYFNLSVSYISIFLA